MSERTRSGASLGDVECDAAAEAESDDVGLLDVEAVEQLEDVVRVCDDRIVGNLARSSRRNPGRSGEMTRKRSARAGPSAQNAPLSPGLPCRRTTVGRSPALSGC